MIIDSHQHFWKYDPVRDSWIDASMKDLRRDFLPADLEGLYKDHGIDGCVAVQADQSEQETDFLLQYATQYPFIKGVVGWVDLLAKDIESRLDHFSNNKYFKGVRHVLQSENDDFMLTPDFQHGISKLGSFDLTYDLLVYPHQLQNTITLVEKYPEQKFVLDHLAKPPIKSKKIDQWELRLRELSKYPNVCCKLSGMLTEADWLHWKKEDFKPYMDVIFDAFGAQRILFGSDWPVCLLAGDYGQVLDIVQGYIKQLPKEEKLMIMGGNAQSFYNLGL